jgi:hypothetical protein
MIRALDGEAWLLTIAKDPGMKRNEAATFGYPRERSF